MPSGLILAGLGIAAVGLIGRNVMRNSGAIKKVVESATGDAFSKYYRGGFEEKMSRREASLILGISPNAKPIKVKEAHKRIMLINHPDRGGSPYIAAKINEAKDLLETHRN